LTPKKVAVVNRQTNIVENIIMINDGDVLDGYDLVDIPIGYTTLDNRFIVYYNINIGSTKWAAETGFTDLNGYSVLTYQKVV
jgi:hypothetical protein